MKNQRRHDYGYPPIRVVRSRINGNLLLMALLVTLFAILHIVLRNDIRKMLIETEKANQETQRLAEQNAFLEAEITEFTSPEYIRSIAEKELDMIDAPNGPIVLRYEREFNPDIKLESELAFTRPAPIKSE